MIPSPLGIICWFRTIYRSVRLGFHVNGCYYMERSRIDGQPRCVTIMRCVTCGKKEVAWDECAKCGYKEPL